MSRLRSSIIVLAAAAGLLGAAALALYGAVRLSWVERHASERLSATLGWPVRVQDLEIRYFPLPTLLAEGVTVADSAEPGHAALLEIGAVDVTVPWRTLAGLSRHLTRLELREPRLRLVEDAQGRGNWNALLDHFAAGEGGSSGRLSIGELVLSGGQAEFTREPDGRVARASGMQLSVEGFRFGADVPLELRLGGEAAGQTFLVTLAGRIRLDPEHETYVARGLTLQGWIGGGDLPLAGVDVSAEVEGVQADLADGRVELSGLQATAAGVAAQGRVEWAAGQGAPSLQFQLGVEPFSPRATAQRLGKALPATADPAALTRAAVSMDGHWTPDGLSLESVRGELDDSHVQGSLFLPAGDGPPRVRLDLDRLDLDRYLPPAESASAAKGGLPAAVAGLRETLEQLELDAVLRIGEARATGVVARDLKVTLEPVQVERAP